LKRITKAALGGVAGCALALGGTGVASGLDGLRILEDARVVSTTTAALDDANANITIKKGTNSLGEPLTTFSIRVTGIDVSGIDFSKPVSPLGSHLHTDECVKGDLGGFQAGPHYNHDAALGITPVMISPDTEVWFDLVPDEEGMAYDETTVPFVPIDSDGVMSVVVHVLPTNPLTGLAGARQACFPLKVSEIFPTEPPSST
jgi:hypothetical protein